MFDSLKLNNMDIRSQNAMEKFLSEVVLWAGDYYLEERIDAGTSGRPKIGCRVVFLGDQSPSPTDWIFANYSYLLDWDTREVVVPAVDLNIELARRFSDGVRNWYLENRKLSEHEIRVLIGKRLYRRFQTNEENHPFDVERVAGELHLSPSEVFNQARVLVQLGYAESKRPGRVWTTGMPPLPPLTQTEELGKYKLSAEGHRWIAAGTPTEQSSHSPNVTVNVDIHVAVSNVIDAAHQSAVDEETKDCFELRMRRLEAELQKPDGEGNMQSVKDVLEVANNAKGLLGPAIKFMSDNWDKIERLGGVMF